MATISSEHEPAAITIPADYLDDVREAFHAELDSDYEALNAASCPDDRGAALWRLREDLNALEYLIGADTETELTGPQGTLFHVLEQYVRQLVTRLEDHMQFGPLDMPTVLTLQARIAWAAERSMSIYPEPAAA